LILQLKFDFAFFCFHVFSIIFNLALKNLSMFFLSVRRNSVLLLFCFLSHISFAAADTLAPSQESGGFILAEGSNCKIFTFNTKSISRWTGACKDGYADGFGKLNRYHDGKFVASMVGQMSEGKLNGQIVTVDSQGNINIQNFVDSKSVDGKLSVITAAGDIFVGDVVAGSSDGNGIYIQKKNFEIYVGNFKNGKANGAGTIFLQNGDRYVGSVKDFKKDGLGIKYSEKGKVQEGLWSDDKFVKESQISK
jgi:hypothetical protein